MRIGALIVVLGIVGLPRVADAQSGCVVPKSGADGWKVGAPESVGLAGDKLCPMLKWLEGWKQANVHAVLVARKGTLVFEHYFAGPDERLGRSQGKVEFGPETKHDERSVSKSVTSLVLGIAIDHGWIKSVDERVFSYFPQYAELRTPEKEKITLRDLLTMSSGLEWHEFGIPYTSAENSEIRMDTSPDPYKFALSPAMVSTPGQVWNYSSGSTELLGAVLRKATGKPLDELARTLLFEPLGITDVEWYKYAGGNPSAAAGLRLRPRDLAKIGQLILQRGAWNGKQVVSSSWIDASTAPSINGLQLYFYGYQYWLGRSLVGKREVHWISAVGLGGQRIMVVPDFDLVVVVNAGMYQSELQGTVPLEILNDYVLPAVTSSTTN